MILLTGGFGYLGRVVLDELIAQGERVRVVDLGWFGSPPVLPPCVEVIRGDVRSPDAHWFNGVSAVIHLAGLSNDPTADYAPKLNADINVHGTRQMALELCRHIDRSEEKAPVPFVYASTCSVYYAPVQDGGTCDVLTEDGVVSPTANYSKSKRMAELALLRVASEFPLFCPVFLRKGTLFGLSPRMRFDLVLNAFVLHIWKAKKITVFGSGEQWRPLLHVRDAADAYVYMAKANAETVRCKAFNLLHKNYRILELAHFTLEVLQKERGVVGEVKRDRLRDSGSRSYNVDGSLVNRTLGFSADRGAHIAIVEMWDALENGEVTEEDVCYNIRWFQQKQINADNG